MTAGDAELLAGFYRRTWDPVATAERVAAARRRGAAANPVAAGEEAPTFVFTIGGEAVGHLTTIPVRVWDGVEERPFHWLKGLMVLPEHRRGPVGYYVLREAARAVGPALAMVVAPEARRLFEGVGFEDLGAPRNHLKPLRSGALLRRLDPARLDVSGLAARAAPALGVLRRSGLAAPAGMAMDAAFAAWTAARGGRRARGGGGGVAGGDVAAAWAACRAGVEAAPSRAEDHWRRYRGGELGAYAEVVARAGGGRAAGVAAVRAPNAGGEPRLNGIRVATLSDLIAPPADAACVDAVLAAAEAAARAAGADALLCTASHAALGPALRRRAYVPLPGNVHFLLRDPDAARPLPRSLDRWWLLRGDSAADDVF